MREHAGMRKPHRPNGRWGFVCVGKLGGVGEAAGGFQSTHPVWGETAIIPKDYLDKDAFIYFCQDVFGQNIPHFGVSISHRQDVFVMSQTVRQGNKPIAQLPGSETTNIRFDLFPKVLAPFSHVSISRHHLVTQKFCIINIQNGQVRDFLIFVFHFNILL